MLMRKRVILLLLLLLPLYTWADEGMWMVNAISRALEQNMTKAGCGLAANEIYNEDAVSLSLTVTGRLPWKKVNTLSPSKLPI